MSAGEFMAGYFNPRTGQGSDTLLNAKHITGPTKATFTAPDNNDWLLVVHCKGPGGTISQTQIPKE
jgi:hypothetical protein